MAFETKDTNDMKILLNENNYAFSILMESGGVTNTDYADYTSNHFITSFRHVMQKPDLSRAQLASMLRIAEKRRRHKNSNSDKWADVMASIVEKGANSNSDITKH
jgi:hypothetical protein